MDRQGKKAGNPLRIALVGIQKIAQASERALDKVGRWQYFAPFFPEFAGNNNPSSLVTNPYADLSRAGLAMRGLRLASENPPALAVLERIRAGIDDPVYQLVAKDLAARDDDAPYRKLAEDLAAAFADEGHAPEKVEDFLETSRALLGRRSSAGFAEAFLTHLVGCCIAEPDSYALELDSLCAMDPAAYQQAFGTLAPDDEAAAQVAPAGTPDDARRQPSFALEVGRFVEAGPVGGAEDVGGMESASRAVYYMPGAADAKRIYPLLPGDSYTVSVGRHPERDERNLALGDADRCVSMEHCVLHVRCDACGGSSVRIEDWSTCGTVVLRQEAAGDFDELRLGELVQDADGAARFAGRKALGRRLDPAEMPELCDGDVVVPAPRYHVGPDGAPVLDLTGCPTAIRVTRVG